MAVVYQEHCFSYRPEVAVPVLHAFTLEHAARVTGVSERRIAWWDNTGVLSPSLSSSELKRSPHGRIYSFRDLVGIRTLGELRDRYRLPLQTLRAIGNWLSERFAEPWTSLRFFIVGKGREADIYFRDPDSGVVVSARRKGQAVIEVQLEPIARQIEDEANKLTLRTNAQIGAVTQNRYVLSNAPVLAGTRIPTAAIWEFHKSGYETSAIIHEYPRLTTLDVCRAIEFERERRQAKAS